MGGKPRIACVRPRFEPLGRTVAIVGGGGKSTLARTLSSAMGVPHVELDALYWKPGWVESDPNDFRQRVAEQLDGADDGWVCDGNYSAKLGDLVIARADTIVFVNMPWRVMFWRVLTRGIARAIDGRRVCGDNRETWRQLVSKDSLVWWHIVNRKRYRRRAERLRALAPPTTPLIELDTPGQLDDFYARLGLPRT